jgi:type III secretion protein V
MQVRAETAVLAPRGYRVLLHGSALAEGTVPPAAGAGVEPLAAAAGAAEAVRVHLWALLRRHAHELLGVAETQRLLDGLASSHRALVREVVPKVVSPALLASVLRRLLEEGVSIRDLRGILEALAARAETPGIDRDPALAAEQVRPALRRWLTLRHAVRAGASAGPGARAGSGPGPLTVAAILIDPEIEEAIRDAVQRSPRGSVLTLEPEVVHDFLAVLRHQLEAQQPALAAAPASGQPAAPASGPAAVSPVVLTAADIRRFVRRLVEVEHPDLAVLSYPELLPDTRVEPAGRITPG